MSHSGCSRRKQWEHLLCGRLASGRQYALSSPLFHSSTPYECSSSTRRCRSGPLLVFVSPSPLQQPPHQTPTTATLPTDPSSRPSCRWQKLTLEVSRRSEAPGPSARGVINPSACPPPSLFPSTPVNPLNSSTQSSTFRVSSTPPSIVLFQTTIFLHFDLGHRPPQVTWHAQHVFIHTQSHI
jgi:hypothetical protein